MGAVALGAILFAVFLVVVAAMLWQEARRSGEAAPAVYVLDDAVSYVVDRLPGEVAGRVAPGDVRSILEWGMLHKQTVGSRTDSGVPVIGGNDSIEFIAERSAGLDAVDIATVLHFETYYLAAIGAVGLPVAGEVAP